MAITKNELLEIEEKGRKEFIASSITSIEYAMKQAAKAQKRNARVDYSPLLDSYLSELVKSGEIRMERDGLTNVILIW